MIADDARITRRTLLRMTVPAGVGWAMARAPLRAEPAERDLPEPSPRKLPRWRGFNLLEMFMARDQKPFREADFAAIAELGFDFARLPLDYRCWTDPGDWTRLREEALKPIDDAVRYGQEHGVHVQINFHRAPGYTVARPPEPKSVWTDREAQDACARHWAHFAGRYRGISNRQLSFNPFNEPAEVEPEPHRRAVARMVEAIRERDPGRLIVCDGRRYGRVPPTELVGLGVAAAVHSYDPHHLTHYRASWVEHSDEWAVPTWPLREGNRTGDREALRRQFLEPWKALQDQGVGVMVGEFGSHNKTPHPVVMAWMRDFLALFKEAGWGWALWNFRGSFGVLDSGRADVTYDTWRGHKLDRAMLELLQSA